MTKGQFYIIEILMRLHNLQADWQGVEFVENVQGVWIGDDPDVVNERGISLRVCRNYSCYYDIINKIVEMDYDKELDEALADEDFWNRVEPYLNESLLSWVEERYDEWHDLQFGECRNEYDLERIECEESREISIVIFLRAVKGYLGRYRFVNGSREPQQEKYEQPQTKPLPNELNTEEALRCFAKAIELGLMSENYEWKLKSKKSLIYFMGKMSEWLELSNRMGAVCWQPFVELFGGEVRNIASTYSKMTTEKEPLPKEADLINRVFEG